MWENKTALSAWKATAITLLFVTVMVLLLFRVEDSSLISLLLLTVGLAIVRPLPFGQWTMIDVCLSLITGYNLISCLYAGSQVQSTHSALLSLLCLTGYFVSRKLFTSERTTRIILQGSYLPIGVALLLVICTFFVFRQSVLSAGFQDTYHFRFLFRPLGYITNAWSEVLLLMLGWVCIVRRYSGVFIFLTILAILLSFSRGAYIALGIYIISWLLIISPKREKLRLLVISIVAVSLIGLCFPIEMRTTLLMNHTVSQQRSTEGRISATQTGWDTFQQHPWVGYGNGNYTFAIDGTLNQDNTLPTTSFAPNILIQVLIEKGIIGILLYLMLTIAIGWTIQKHWKQPESRIVACVLLALIAKEMTQATLLYTPFALFLVYVLLAFLQKEEVSTEKEDIRKSVSDYLLPAIISVCCLCWIVFCIQQERTKSVQQKSLEAFEKGKYTEAFRLMKLTGTQTPNLINQGLLHLQYYRKTGVAKSLQEAEQLFQKANHRQPEDVQIRYLLLLLYLDEQNTEKALPIAKELAAKYQKNSLYLSALSDVLYKQGEKDAALLPLINAIRYTPRLLTGQRILNLQQNDQLFYNTLYQHLSRLAPSSEDDPADYARLGYIARWCGSEYASEEYLRKAVNDLPNLAIPWHFLGDDHKYRLLRYGAFIKDLSAVELQEEKEMNDDLLFEDCYKTKFDNWYGCELITFKHE